MVVDDDGGDNDGRDDDGDDNDDNDGDDDDSDIELLVETQSWITLSMIDMWEAWPEGSLMIT